VLDEAQAGEWLAICETEETRGRIPASQAIRGRFHGLADVVDVD
jgi:hypothetical protein